MRACRADNQVYVLLTEVKCESIVWIINLKWLLPKSSQSPSMRRSWVQRRDSLRVSPQIRPVQLRGGRCAHAHGVACSADPMPSSTAQTTAV